MIEKVSQAAEKLATTASRRGFLTRVGKTAAGAAAVFAGFLALPTPAQSAVHCGGVTCPSGYNFCCSYFDTIIKKRVRYCSVTPCR